MTEWFFEPRANVIQSDEGFSVEVLGRTGMRYSECGKTAFIDSEVLAEPDAIVAYKNSIKHWEPPHESEAIDANDRERILRNIKRAFEFRGYELRVI